jgi:site-specific DNA-methyltransferase (adenine-specific)
MIKPKEKKRKPGRPWDKVERVEPRVGKAVRFPPEDYKMLEQAATKTNESIEGFIKTAVRERVTRVQKRSSQTDDNQSNEKRQHAMQVMSSSRDMTWETPQEWFDALNLEFGFTLDPCCQAETAKCKKFFTPKEDGLSQSWKNERVYMNPPYGRQINKWMEKAFTESRDNHAMVVCFIPARTDTIWWHSFAVKASEIRYPKGRVKNPDGQSWTFPIAIVIFRPRM